MMHRVVPPPRDPPGVNLRGYSPTTSAPCRFEVERGRDEGLGVGFARLAEDPGCGAPFHDRTFPHHQHLVAHSPDDAALWRPSSVRGSIEPGMAVTSASVPPVIGAAGGFGP